MTKDETVYPDGRTGPDAALRRELRSRARTLEARLRLGKSGWSEGFGLELERLLRDSGLVKVRFEKSLKPCIDELAAELTRRHACHLIQKVGRVLVLWRSQGSSGSGSSGSGSSGSGSSGSGSSGSGSSGSGSSGSGSSGSGSSGSGSSGSGSAGGSPEAVG